MKTNIVLSAVLAIALAGCATLATFATPSRIKAVTALGAYVGAKKAIEDGKRVDVQKSLTALQFIASTGKVDLPAIAQALEISGVKIIDSVEGELVVNGLTILFTDFWSGTPQQVLESERAQAVVDGVIDGFQRAITASTRRGVDSNLVELRKNAEATRLQK